MTSVEAIGHVLHVTDLLPPCYLFYNFSRFCQQFGSSNRDDIAQEADVCDAGGVKVLSP
jgi:hypothetical protein